MEPRDVWHLGISVLEGKSVRQCTEKLQISESSSWVRNVHFPKTTKPKIWTQVLIFDLLPKPGFFLAYCDDRGCLLYVHNCRAIACTCASRNFCTHLGTEGSLHAYANVVGLKLQDLFD